MTHYMLENERHKNGHDRRYKEQPELLPNVQLLSILHLLINTLLKCANQSLDMRHDAMPVTNKSID